MKKLLLAAVAATAFAGSAWAQTVVSSGTTYSVGQSHSGKVYQGCIVQDANGDIYQLSPLPVHNGFGGIGPRNVMFNLEGTTYRPGGGVVNTTQGTSLVGNWRVAGVRTSSGLDTTNAGLGDLSLNFGANGSISGNNGCNQFSGLYTLSGNQFNVGAPLAVSARACLRAVPFETALIEALNRAARVQQTGNRITFLNSAGQVELELIR